MTNPSDDATSDGHQSAEGIERPATGTPQRPLALDDMVCQCNRVTLRKLLNYARRERPRRASQMAGCLGAGTGCGSCIPILEKVAEDPDGFPVFTEPED